MKKTRLLEIVREEIAFALNEAGLGDQITALDKQIEAGTKQITPIQKKVADLQKKKADLQKKEADLSAKSQTQLEEKQSSKYKQLAEKYQLDEDTINEMASIVQTKKVLTKLGDEKRLELVKDIEKETLDQFKKDPIMSSDGRLARKLDPEEQTGKKDTRGFGADFERNFKKKAGMDFLDFTTQIDIELKKKFPEEKFTPGLATNTTEKEAAAQIFGLEKGQRGRKADPNKPEKAPSTGQRGRPAGTAKEKVATRTPGDDGFDTVTYSDKEDEEGPSAQDISGDETAKELSNIPADKKDKFNLGLKFINKYKDDKAKVDAYLKKAKDEYKLPKTMMDDLKRAAGRGVE
jgi:hypothetical protein